jgi:hypothetical protein
VGSGVILGVGETVVVGVGLAVAVGVEVGVAVEVGVGVGDSELSYSSALAEALMLLSTPPAASTLPLGSNVAVCS